MNSSSSNPTPTPSAAYAHTKKGQPPEEWEPLEVHLEAVADLAASFSAVFGARDWGRLAGLWHDVGKYSEAFQEYLKRSAKADTHSAETAGRVDHSTAGAQHASATCGTNGRLLAYCIAGHHAGLPDWESGDSGLRHRLQKKVVEPFDRAPAPILRQGAPSLPNFDWSQNIHRLPFQVSFFMRMLFSCLVDADFLATEEFMNTTRAASRPDANPTPSELLDLLNTHLAKLTQSANPTPVNLLREQVLDACRSKATHPPGLFSLNVPTGGGKTFSSLAFALTHAKAHGLDRVIYAVPFTSIIEQTADEFRKALGNHADAVLEHHSNIDPENPCKQTTRSRLAAENWDATIIATTNVQLFDSLFASRTSRCRKLHRLARSVIVLDEAQVLPPELLAPTLQALGELVRNYGSTVVLCTATQPAIELREGFPIGLDGVVPIIENPMELHESLRRTRVEVVGVIDDEDLARRLADERQALCIVNSRRHAADLFQQVCAHTGGDGCFHLSASMCPSHRTEVIAEVRNRLDPKVNHPCRVISTQVIEAGVDVDFPIVYRAAAGLDSIVQAAGRCNREGRLQDGQGRLVPGRVVVFNYDERLHRAPPFIRRAAKMACEVIPDHADDLLAPDAVEQYFRLRYWQQGGDDGRGWDKGRGEGNPSVLECFSNKGLDCQFRQAAERYRLIDDAQTSVLVPWGDGGAALRRELVEMSDDPEPKHLRSWGRRAQRYSVGVFDRDLRKLLENQVLLERHDRYYLANDKAYDSKLGLTFEAVGLNPEDQVV